MVSAVAPAIRSALSILQAPETVRGQIDLNTILITIVLAICGWTLQSVLRHARALTQIEQQLWGKDGKNGHSSDIRRLLRGWDRIGRFLHELDHRVSRLEERHGLSSGERRKYTAPDADQEDE